VTEDAARRVVVVVVVVVVKPKEETVVVPVFEVARKAALEHCLPTIRTALLLVLIITIMAVFNQSINQSIKKKKIE
jgi:hypothetical protein